MTRSRATGLLRPLARAGNALLDLIYPPSCLVCRRAVAAHGAICPECWRDIAFIERPYCERLGTPFERDLAQPGLISLEAAANPPAFGRARAVARYDSDKARALAHRLKYYDRLELAEPMGRWMARAGAELLADADVIVPIPLHRLRILARRFNQSAALAQVDRARERRAGGDHGAAARQADGAAGGADAGAAGRQSLRRLSRRPGAGGRHPRRAMSCWSTTC